VVLTPAGTAVHGLRAQFAEDIIQDKHAVVAAQRFAAVMAYRVDPYSFSFGYMALGAFPGHLAS
jgi:hypothetical protein